MSVGIFQNGEYNKVAGNAKDSTAANTTYNNGTSGLQANNVQSAIDEVSAKIGQENISQVGNSVTGAINNLNSNFNNYEIKIIISTETTSDVGTLSFNYTNELSNGGTFLFAYTANNNYWCKLYGLSNGNCVLGIADFNNQNSRNTQHTVYSYWLVKKSK